MKDKKFESNPSIGVISIATNIYLDYWKSMVHSADERTTFEDSVTFFVFTDNPQEAKLFAGRLKNVRVQAIKIPSYKWPEATLFRYKIIESFNSLLKTDLLMHLDADMIFNSNPWIRIKSQLTKNDVCLVRHPGFWRPARFKKIQFYLKYPSFGFRDFRMKIMTGGLGTWEKNVSSAAFVSRKMRKNYVCGGIWFGERDAICKLAKVLAANVETDLHNGIIANWHDESHLNKWSSENVHGTEKPELCFDETYPQIKELKPWILAVRKSEMIR